jgi:hypothetical protein
MPVASREPGRVEKRLITFSSTFNSFPSCTSAVTATSSATLGARPGSRIRYRGGGGYAAVPGPGPHRSQELTHPMSTRSADRLRKALHLRVTLVREFLTLLMDGARGDGHLLSDTGMHRVQEGE